MANCEGATRIYLYFLFVLEMRKFKFIWICCKQGVVYYFILENYLDNLDPKFKVVENEIRNIFPWRDVYYMKWTLKHPIKSNHEVVFVLD